MSEYSHQELVDRGRKWLKRKPSQQGPDCRIALSEIASGHSGEIPDCIGWRYSGDQFDGSHLLEIKVTRADFLADRHKPHRDGTNAGIGMWRYYLCPEGLIDPQELPNKWGLIYAKGKRQLKVICGPTYQTSYGDREQAYKKHRFDVEWQRELFILTRLFDRVGDPDVFREQLKSLYRGNERLKSELAAASEERDVAQKFGNTEEVTVLVGKKFKRRRQYISEKNGTVTLIGTGIEVKNILRVIASGAPPARVFELYPDLTPKHIEACLRHTAAALHRDYASP